MNNPQQTWKQTYDYDKYGNRTAFTQNIHGENLAINNITLPQVNAATNRFNGGQGYEYDKIGNLTKDVAKVNGVIQSRDIKFNGDNKQIEIKDSSTGIKIGEYFYDGSGKRVKKHLFDANGVAKEDVIFIYSGDKLVAEYSTLPPPTNPTTKYVATDTLGSIRAMTNEYGEVVSRRDFMPFGEELQADATYRKANLKYNPDDVRQKFTGYQKDEETGLDFAEARMYNNAHARFTAVDPLLASGKSANPQTFNRYVYVMNNPIAYTDPDGLQAGKTSAREYRFALRHPISAKRIGKYSLAGKNISSAAGRFAVNSSLSTNTPLKDEGGSQRNAFRHVFLAEMITVSEGASIAKKATDAHEKSGSVDLNTLPSSSQSLVDQAIDLENNAIGINTGKGISKSKTKKEIAIIVLDGFKKDGYFTAKKDGNGKYTIERTKIDQKTYDSTLKEWRGRNKDGFTPGHLRREAAKEKQKLIDDSRRRRPEE